MQNRPRNGGLSLGARILARPGMGRKSRAMDAESRSFWRLGEHGVDAKEGRRKSGTYWEKVRKITA